MKGWPSFDEHLEIMSEPYDGQDVLSAEGRWAKQQLAKGNEGAMLYMLSTCLRNKEPVPEWLARELLSAIRKVRMLEVTSWDDVFGRPLEKGQRAEVIRRNNKMGPQVYRHVWRRRRAGEAVDNEMFSRIGAELNMSGSVIRQIYYETKDECEHFIWEEQNGEFLQEDSK